MSRITPAEPTSTNPLVNAVLARVLGRCPDILQGFAALDSAARFHGALPLSLKESVRRATAEKVGCEYCRSLAGGAPPSRDGVRESLAVAFAELIAEDANAISDAQFDVLREEFTEEEIVELVAYTCFVAIAGQMFGAIMDLQAAPPEESAAYQAALERRN
jgi:alkylhydroperoxidase family enzyme